MTGGTLTTAEDCKNRRGAIQRNGGDLDLFDDCRAFYENARVSLQVMHMPCPCCGAPDATLWLERSVTGGVNWTVRCEACAAAEMRAGICHFDLEGVYVPETGDLIGGR